MQLKQHSQSDKAEENPEEFVTPLGESTLENRAALLAAVCAAEEYFHNAEVPRCGRGRPSKSNTARIGRTTQRHQSFTAREQAEDELRVAVRRE